MISLRSTRCFKIVIIDEIGPKYTQDFDEVQTAISGGEKIMIDKKDEQLLGFYVFDYFGREVFNSIKNKEQKFTRFEIMDI